jgi:hypothetical protein
MMAFSQSHSKASDATIDWHYVGPPPFTSVTSFTLTPTNPTTLSLITFIAPTDRSNYLNSCFASFDNGYPNIVVDPTNQTINITFSGHPSVCPNIAAPVSGLEGHVGPLTAGIWSIIVDQRFPPAVYSFSVELVPSISVQAGIGSSLELSWPVSGDNYALEFTENLASGNWRVVTNSPTISSNYYTLQISGDSGSRFFRLHRH